MAIAIQPDKCIHLELGNTDNHEYSTYLSTNGNTLKTRPEESELLAIVDNKINWDEHIRNKINKANRIMYIILRRPYGMNT